MTNNIVTHTTPINKLSFLSRPTKTNMNLPTLHNINYYHQYKQITTKRKTLHPPRYHKLKKLVNNFHQHDKDITSNTSIPYLKQHDTYKKKPSEQIWSNTINKNTYLSTTLLTDTTKQKNSIPELPIKKFRYHLSQIIPYLLQEITTFTNHINYPTPHKKQQQLIFRYKT